jgi:hypothetical protein
MSFAFLQETLSGAAKSRLIGDEMDVALRRTVCHLGHADVGEADRAAALYRCDEPLIMDFGAPTRHHDLAGKA